MTDAEFVASLRTHCQTVTVSHAVAPNGIHPQAARRYAGSLDRQACPNRAAVVAHISYPGSVPFDIRLCPECAARMHDIVLKRMGTFEEAAL